MSYKDMAYFITEFDEIIDQNNAYKKKFHREKIPMTQDMHETMEEIFDLGDEEQQSNTQAIFLQR